MKRVKITPELKARLQSAAGAGVDTANHAVYEAIGLNTKPVRKDHPLYKHGTHSATYLNQMADQVNKESLPLQVMHDGNSLPAGRIFHGSVVGGDAGPELRVLFWVDPANSAISDLIDSGTLDQVSVSTLAKDASCSSCGWNFLGADSTMERVFAGACLNGHQLGKDGAHVNMNNLDQWFEMSLVGRGGAPGAFICSPDNSVLTNDFRLAASGKAASWLALSLSSKDLELSMPMTLDELSATVTAQLKSISDDMAAMKAAANKPKTDGDPDTNSPSELAALQAQLGVINDKIKAMTQTTTAPIPDVGSPTTDDAGNFLLDGSPAHAFAKKILVMSGDPEAIMPKDAKALAALLDVKLAALLAKKTPVAGASQDAAANATLVLAAKPATGSAFKTAR
jgi:hypothetical protein